MKLVGGQNIGKSVDTLVGLTVIGLLFVLALLPFALADPVWADRLQRLNAPSLHAGDALTTVLARLLVMLGTEPTVALLASSAAAVPFLAAIMLPTNGRKSLSPFRAVMILGHPITAYCVALGYGWALVGLYTLWRTLTTIPVLPPSRGLPLAGLAIGVCVLTVPGFDQLLLPLCSVLFLCAPKRMVTRDMAVYYVLSFAPAFMVMGSLAYIDWLLGAPEALVDIVRPALDPLVTDLAILAMGFSVAWFLNRPRRLAALGLGFFWSFSPLVAPLPVPVILAAIWFGVFVLVPLTPRGIFVHALWVALGIFAIWPETAMGLRLVG